MSEHSRAYMSTPRGSVKAPAILKDGWQGLSLVMNELACAFGRADVTSYPSSPWYRSDPDTPAVVSIVERIYMYPADRREEVMRDEWKRAAAIAYRQLCELRIIEEGQ